MNPDDTNNNITTPQNLKQRIMRRIYRVFLLRHCAPLAFDSLVAVVVAFAATFFVSFADVWNNLGTARDSGGLSRFSLSAFSDTELETKFLLLVLGVVGFLAVRDLGRAWRAVRTVLEKAKPPEKVRESDRHSVS